MPSALFLHSRVKILAIFQSDNTPQRAGDIAHTIGSYREHAYAFLEKMRAAGEIDRQPLRRRYSDRWAYFATRRGLLTNLQEARTALPILKTRERQTDQRFDHRALSEALNGFGGGGA